MLELWFFLSCVALGTLKNILFQQQLVLWTEKQNGTTDSTLGSCLCLQVKCTNQHLKAANWKRSLKKIRKWSTLSRYKILDFVKLTSPCPLPLCFYLSPHAPAPPPCLLIAAVWKKLQEKQLPQRKKKKKNNTCCSYTVYLVDRSKTTHQSIRMEVQWALNTFTSTHQSQ